MSDPRLFSPMDSPLDARVEQGMRPLTRGELQKLLRQYGGDWKDGFPKNVNNAISPGGSKRQRMVNAADESEEEETRSEGARKSERPAVVRKGDLFVTTISRGAKYGKIGAKGQHTAKSKRKQKPKRRLEKGEDWKEVRLAASTCEKQRRKAS